MSAADYTMHPRDQFRLRREQDTLVVQRRYATRPMAAPAEEWRDIQPDDVIHQPGLASLIDKRLNPGPDFGWISRLGDYEKERKARRRHIWLGFVMGAASVGLITALALYARSALS